MVLVRVLMILVTFMRTVVIRLCGINQNDDDQPEPINIGVSFALVLVSKGVKGGDIHTRNLCNLN